MSAMCPGEPELTLNLRRRNNGLPRCCAAMGLRHSFSGLDLSITPVKPILEVPHLMHA
jgi:hypothetical protein